MSTKTMHLAQSVACSGLKGVLGDRFARVVALRRRKKLLGARVAVTDAEGGTTSASSGFAFASTGWPENAASKPGGSAGKRTGEYPFSTD